MYVYKPYIHLIRLVSPYTAPQDQQGSPRSVTEALDILIISYHITSFYAFILNQTILYHVTSLHTKQWAPITAVSLPESLDRELSSKPAITSRCHGAKVTVVGVLLRKEPFQANGSTLNLIGFPTWSLQKSLNAFFLGGCRTEELNVNDLGLLGWGLG